MLRRLVLAVVLALAPLTGAEALTCTNYPFTLLNGTLADANQVMANFNGILNCVNTSLAPLNNPTFTGTVTAPTITVGTLTVNTSLVVPGSISFSSPLAPVNGGTGLTTYGALTNQKTAITSATTILNGSKGQTINAGGSAFYTIGLNAVAGYDSDFQVTINNTDAGRGKSIVPNGISSFILWPGQRTTCQNQGSSWNCSPPGRWQQQSANFYVDSANGNDGNDCLATGTGACRTIGHAVDQMKRILDAQNSEPTINVACGTYIENVSTQGQITGYNVWLLKGQTPGQPSAACSSIQLAAAGAGILVSDNDEVQIQNINVTNVGGQSNASAFATHQTAVIDLLGGNTVFGGTFVAFYSCDNLGRGSLSGGNILFSATVGNAIQLGSQCYFAVSGGSSIAWVAGQTVTGEIFNLSGGAVLNLANGVGTPGAPTCFQQWVATGNSYIALGGNTITACTNPGAPAAGTTPWGGQVSP